MVHDAHVGCGSNTAWREVRGERYSELANITQPTLVVNGNHDIMVPTINSFILSQKIPQAQLIIYPDSGHGALPIFRAVRSSRQIVPKRFNLIVFNFARGKPMLCETPARSPGADWRALVCKNGTKEFAAAFAANPVLDTSVMYRPCVGVDAIESFFATTNDMYDSLTFTNETVDGAKTYLEWEGKAFGTDVGGTTIVTQDEAGLLGKIRLYHRPLQIVQLFSRRTR